MRRFKSVVQAQCFLGTQAAVYNLFNLGRHWVMSQPLSGSEIPRLCVLGSGNGSLTERA